MRFSDIPQFIRGGSWEVDVKITEVDMVLEGWEKTYGVILNPDFQRGHVWNEEQQIKFVEFLLQNGRTARVIYFNSPAFGDGERGDLDETILCVDGLQRLTAVKRFVNNEFPIFGQYYFKDFTDSPRMMHSLKFNMNCLKNRKEVLEWYLQFNSGGTVHSPEELNRVRQLLEEELKK